jgi:hypothetical protein
MYKIEISLSKVEWTSFEVNSLEDLKEKGNLNFGAI